MNSTVTELNLSWNSIGDAGATAIAEALRVNSTVTKLDLLGNSIGDAGATAIAEALRVNSAVTKLGLSSNSIGVTWNRIRKLLERNGGMRWVRSREAAAVVALRFMWESGRAVWEGTEEGSDEFVGLIVCGRPWVYREVVWWL